MIVRCNLNLRLTPIERLKYQLINIFNYFIELEI